MNIESLKFSILDITNEKEIIDYEQGLYEAFVLNIPDKWIMNKYKIIDNKRLQSYIPYSEQEIYTGKINDKIICAAAINFNQQITQAEDIGFTIIKDKKIADGINMYISNKVPGTYILKLLPFFDYVLNILKSKNIGHWYGTCSRQMLTLYKMLDFEVLDKRIVDNEEEFLIRYTL
jgi:hypothetical protein